MRATDDAFGEIVGVRRQHIGGSNEISLEVRNRGKFSECWVFAEITTSRKDENGVWTVLREALKVEPGVQVLETVDLQTRTHLVSPVASFQIILPD